MNEKLTSISISINAGVTVNNIKFNPVLIPIKYEINKGVGDKTQNLIKYPFASTTKIVNGVTFTDNDDGTITVNGTATADC